MNLLITLAIIFRLLHKCICNIPERSQRTANSYARAAVAADHTQCSQVGVEVLKKNGSAVDSYIATCLCSGIMNPMSSGIGGGGFAVVYDRQQKKHYVYDYRETAPLAMNEEFFKGRYYESEYGVLSIAVPSQIKGLWKMHQKHGRLPWKDLFDPAIKLAEDGAPVTASVSNSVKYVEKKLWDKNDNIYRGIKSYLIKSDGTYLQEKDIMKNVELANTLRKLQEANISAFYEGDLAHQMVKELNEDGGIITLKDLKSYEVKIREAVTLTMPGDLKLITTPAPGGGPCLALIINIMSGFNFSHYDITNNEEDAFQFYQKYIETLKFSLAERGFLADPDFGNLKPILDKLNTHVTNLTVGEVLRKKIKMNETHGPLYYGDHWTNDGGHGTSHTSILAENGDAVAGTNTINVIFGSLYRSSSTGVIYNNVINDFSIKGSENIQGVPSSLRNFVAPGKRSVSTTTPTIITDANGDVKMVVGASGGPRIMMGVSQVILKALMLNMELGDAITSYRLYHTGPPLNVVQEYNPIKMPDSLRNRLKNVGHIFQDGFKKSVVQAIVRKDLHDIVAMSDPRKHAHADGY